MSIDYTYRARLIRAVDADTVRLRGVNAPERNAIGGPEATAWTRALITDAELLVTSYRDRMTFARWVCDLQVLDDDGTHYDLAESMIHAGHAVRYP